MWIVERMHTANAVYFSIFYCGCKQLKSIHLEFRCKGTTFRANRKISAAKRKKRNEISRFTKHPSRFYKDFTEMQPPMPRIAASGISLSTIAFGVGLFHNCVNQHHTVIFVHIVGLCICA